MDRPVNRGFLLLTAVIGALMIGAMNACIAKYVRPPASHETSEFTTWARAELNFIRGQLQAVVEQARKDGR